MTAPPGFDDAALLARIVHKDETALAALYDRYARVLYAVAFKSLTSAEESEEVVLDVFSQVWRIAERYDATKSRADTWLFMLTRSRILDRLRVIRRSTQKILLSSQILETQPPQPSSDVLENALVVERRQQVLSALSILPSEQRLAIELAYYGGFSHREIATQTGWSLGTVKTRIRLGLNKLRNALGSWE